MMRRFGFLILMLAAVSIATPAFADTLDFTLANPVGYGSPGSTVGYYATVNAPTTNVGAIFLNSDSFNFAGSLSLDDSGFLNNFPLQLDPGQSYTGLLFDITLPAQATIGALYNGSFEILGGLDGNVLNTLGSANFGVSVTPEPSTFLLLGTGLLAMGGIVRRRLAL